MRQITVVAPQGHPSNYPDRACADVDPELFFPDDAQAAKRAQRVCAHCPVLAECASWAKRAGITEGVVASVWMPAATARKSSREAARQRLDHVARTGEPSQWVSVNPGEAVWRDPAFQHEVFGLRAEVGLTWERIAARLQVSPDTARRAYAIRTGAGAGGSDGLVA
ncbi:WhiB family transcriptional regulator [Nocardia tengchongensis]|uniref:WhiB family transcriptional regulator n=1 Tax=Nocardia tengchongensis TaxID=2055889 RepID=UPI0036A18467